MYKKCFKRIFPDGGGTSIWKYIKPLTKSNRSSARLKRMGKPGMNYGCAFPNRIANQLKSSQKYDKIMETEQI